MGSYSHIIEYNHLLCSPSKRYLLPSQREVSEEDILFVKQLRKLGIRIGDAYPVLKKHREDLIVGLWLEECV